VANRQSPAMGGVRQNWRRKISRNACKYKVKSTLWQGQHEFFCTLISVVYNVQNKKGKDFEKENRNKSLQFSLRIWFLSVLILQVTKGRERH
jgi:hypothetical protein